MLLREIPSPLQHPIYLFVCILMGLLGLALSQWAETKEEWFRARVLACCKSFSLPWFAILGAQGARARPGDLRRDLRGPLATTAGVLIDLFSGVTPRSCGRRSTSSQRRCCRPESTQWSRCGLRGRWSSFTSR